MNTTSGLVTSSLPDADASAAGCPVAGGPAALDAAGAAVDLAAHRLQAPQRWRLSSTAVPRHAGLTSHSALAIHLRKMANGW